MREIRYTKKIALQNMFYEKLKFIKTQIYSKLNIYFIQYVRVIWSLLKFEIKYFLKTWEKITITCLVVISAILLYISLAKFLKLLTNIYAHDTFMTISVQDIVIEAITISVLLSVISSIIRWLYNVLKMIKTIKNYNKMRPEVIRPDINNLKLTERYVVNGYKIEIYNNEIIIHSPKVNNFLKKLCNADDKTPLWSETKCQERHDLVKKYIANNSWFLEKYYVSLVINLMLKEEKVIFDENKLCLADDLVFNGDKLDFSYYKGTYFESMLTNEMYNKVFYINSEKQFFFSQDLFLKHNQHNNYVEEILQMGFNNHIGCSMLALTKDNNIILWKQSEESAQGAGKYVSTGSGSVDWADYEKTDKAFDAILRGMKREVIEECFGKINMKNQVTEGEFAKYIDCKVQLVGFYRWYDRGGKPEFAGICRLGVNARDVNGDNFENKGTKAILFVNTINKLIDVMDGIIKGNVDNHDVKISLSLRANAFFVKQWAEDTPNDASCFLQLPIE